MKWSGRFFGYYILNFFVALGLLFLYGHFDPYAGYYVLVLPVSVFLATVIMVIIRYKFQNINKVLFFLLSPILNVVSLVGLFVFLIFMEFINNKY